MTKLDKARVLLSHRLADKSFEKVFEAMIDEFLERHSPGKKQERREKRAEKRAEKSSGKMAEERHEPGNPASRRDDPPETRRIPESADRHNPRHIPESIRDAVFRRDQGRCTYVGSTGKRCGSTDHLQIDHIVPYAKGGTNTAGNLRLSCGKHNRLEAERVYGATAIRRYRRRE